MEKKWEDYFTCKPCKDGWDEFSSQAPESFWRTTKRGDWMLWELRNNIQGYIPPKEKSVAFARSCADAAEKYYAAADDADAAAADYAARYAAEAAEAAADAAEQAELERQADWIRENIEYPFGGNNA